jgi:hypothetical protein
MRLVEIVLRRGRRNGREWWKGESNQDTL